MYVHFNRVEIVDGNVFRTKYGYCIYEQKRVTKDKD